MTTISIKRDRIQFEAGWASNGQEDGYDQDEAVREWESETVRAIESAGYEADVRAEHGRDHTKHKIGVKVGGCWFWRAADKSVAFYEPHLTAALDAAGQEADDADETFDRAATRLGWLAEAKKALDFAHAI